MKDGEDILVDPMLLIHRAVENGSAAITFLDDADKSIIKRFYHQLKGLTQPNGRAYGMGVYIRRDGHTIHAIADPKLMPRVLLT